MLEKVKEFVKQQNEKYGEELYSEPIMCDGYITYTFNIQDDTFGTMYEVDPETGYERHCGTGKGCFWTDFEPTF